MKDLTLLVWVSNKIDKINSFVEKVNIKYLEMFSFILYTILHFVVSFFHEPWFDEAIAWQIARGASIRDIIFYLPHFEGHPPLWHLLLVPFAKTGVPYELALSIVSYIFSGAAIALIIFKSPFPRIVRLLVPFTYFFFYQYSVIARPYCVMMLAFVLCAITYAKKDEKPFQHVGALILLCLSSAYGMIYAGGIALVWVVDVVRKESLLGWIKKCMFEKRTYAMATLLFTAIFLVILIVPDKNTLGISYEHSILSAVLAFFYLFFGIFSDLGVTNFYVKDVLLRDYLEGIMTFDIFMLISICIIGLFFLVVMFNRFPKKVLLFILPHFFMCCFSVLVYFTRHHMGVVLLFLVFWLWIACLDEKKEKTSLIKVPIKMTTNLLFAVALVVSICWSGIASINEFRYTYSSGREEAKFIKDHGLDKYRLLSACSVIYEQNEDGDFDYLRVKYINTNHFKFVDLILPYFEKNIFAYNSFGVNSEMPYMLHQIPDEQTNKLLFNKWREIGNPEVIIASSFFGDNPVCSNDVFTLIETAFTDCSLAQYEPVYINTCHNIWKESTKESYVTIWLRKDLLEETGLKSIDN